MLCPAFLHRNCRSRGLCIGEPVDTRSEEALRDLWLARFSGRVLDHDYVVLPLSAVDPSAFKPGLFLSGVIGHAFFLGLP